MKKVIGLFLVILISSVSVFAQEKGSNRRDKRNMDPTKRWEKMAEDLKLDDKQAAEFKKINEEFRLKMKAKHEEQRENMLAMHNERNEEMKKVLTDEQYQQFIEKQKPGKDRKHTKDGMYKRDRKERARK